MPEILVIFVKSTLELEASKIKVSLPSPPLIVMPLPEPLTPAPDFSVIVSSPAPRLIVVTDAPL